MLRIFSVDDDDPSVTWLLHRAAVTGNQPFGQEKLEMLNATHASDWPSLTVTGS